MKSSDLFINNKMWKWQVNLLSAFYENVMIHDKLAIVHVYNKITPMSSYE